MTESNIFKIKFRLDFQEIRLKQSFELIDLEVATGRRIMLAKSLKNTCEEACLIKSTGSQTTALLKTELLQSYF